MMEASAIKSSDGEIIAIGMTQAQAWNASANRVAASAETVHSCVPVTVSEKGEADSPPMMDLGDYYGVQDGPFVYLQRKAIRTATDAPMEDYERAIITLCDHLSRKEQA